MVQTRSKDSWGYGYFSDGSRDWLDSDLWDAPGEVSSMRLSDMQDFKMVQTMAEDFERISKADLAFPVVLTPEGLLADGYHRAAKALLEGETHILVKRLHQMPRPYRRVGLVRRLLNWVHDRTADTDSD